MRRPINKHTWIVPTRLDLWGENVEAWRLKMAQEGISDDMDVHAELSKYHGYMQTAGHDDVIPGEVEIGKTYLYFRDQKAYNWFVLRWAP